MKKRHITLGLAIAGLTILVSSLFNSCKKDKDENEPTPGTNEVWMQSNVFKPATITVSVNTTITWTNKDGALHTVTSDTGSELNSANLGNGATYSHQFTAVGTFPYHCTFHSGMTGKVVVN